MCPVCDGKHVGNVVLATFALGRGDEQKTLCRRDRAFEPSLSSCCSRCVRLIARLCGGVWFVEDRLDGCICVLFGLRSSISFTVAKGWLGSSLTRPTGSARGVTTSTQPWEKADDNSQVCSLKLLLLPLQKTPVLM